MAVNSYQVHVVRAGVKEDGLVLVNCTSRSDVWPGARWWVVPHTNPGASAFLATALTCVSTGLPANLSVDESLQEFGVITQLYVERI